MILNALALRIREEKNSINIKFWARISRGHSWPLTPGRPWSKSFTPSPGPQENALFGADVHDFWRGRPWPEGVLKNFVQKKFALIFWPLNDFWMLWPWEHHKHLRNKSRKLGVGEHNFRAHARSATGTEQAREKDMSDTLMQEASHSGHTWNRKRMYAKHSQGLFQNKYEIKTYSSSQITHNHFPSVLFIKVR